MTPALLEIEDLRMELPSPLGPATILRGVDLRAERGEVVGIVGESGCGKTMTGRVVMGLQPEAARVSGRVWFEGEDLLALGPRALRRLRGRRIAMVFQDPSAALNPVFTIGDQLIASLRHHGIAKGRQAVDRAAELLDEVGLADPRGTLDRYPHELSGGMQQRAVIAIALAAGPDVLIADEPTTALDVTVEAQILALLLGLRESRNVTVLLVSHNIEVIARTCDRVAVLYAGLVVEEGPVQDVLRRPRHPYTQALLAALPTPEQRGQPLRVITGRVPSGLDAVRGCVFAPRCPEVMPRCLEEAPAAETDGPVTAACWLLADREEREA